MPEGDTIYRTARALQKALGGKVVTDFETGVAKLARVNDDSPLVGRVVEKVEARGKWCLIFFSGDLILVSHMLMSGAWHVYRTGETWFVSRSKMRVVITVGDRAPQGLKPVASSVANGAAEAVPLRGLVLNRNAEAVPLRGFEVFPTHAPSAAHEWATRADVGYEAVLFNAQVMEFHTARSLERSSQVPKLGLDVLAEGFSVERGVKAMREWAMSHPEDEVGVVLLNQRVMAGVGNLYKSEVAFAAGVNPFRRMKTVTDAEMEKMVEVALKYMKANVADEGSVIYAGPQRTTGAMDRSDRVWVYRKQGQECRRCGTAIMMWKQGAAVRSTYWCPRCQPWVGEGEAPVGKDMVVGRR